MDHCEILQAMLAQALIDGDEEKAAALEWALQQSGCTPQTYIGGTPTPTPPGSGGTGT